MSFQSNQVIKKGTCDIKQSKNGFKDKFRVKTAIKYKRIKK